MRTYKGRVSTPHGPHFSTHERKAKYTTRASRTVPTPSGAKRLPTEEERVTMAALLDRMLDDERRLREAHRTPMYGPLYHPDIEQLMDDCVVGRAINPELLWRILDAMDAFHRQADATPKEYARARFAMRDVFAE
jgi:hypothetical protein